MKDKRGFATLGLFLLIVLGLAFTMILGVFLYYMGQLDSALSGNIMTGDFNLSNASANTVGKINTGFLNGADLLGIMFIFGMVIGVILAGYFTRDENPRVFFFIEFIWVLGAYILSTYISNAYETILVTLPFQDLIISNLSKTSTLMLILPEVVAITGFIAILITYAGIPKRREVQIPGI